MSTWIKYMIVLVAGIIIGAISAFFITRAIYSKRCPPCDKEVEKQVTTTIISGKPGTIKHSKWNYKGTAVCFETHSTGTATIKTNIDKDLIPEAHKWMKYKHGIQGSYSGIIYNDGYYRHIFGADYLHRWNWFALGIGPRISYYETKEGKFWGGGFNVAAQVWFKGKD